MQKEKTSAAALINRKDSGEAEKKRLWAVMTKDDVWELGRRDAKREQQKPMLGWISRHREIHP